MNLRTVRDLFDAICTACGIESDDLTAAPARTIRSIAGRLLELREPATPEEVRRRASNFRTRYSVDLTPAALEKHWAICKTPKGGGRPVEARPDRARVADLYGEIENPLSADELRELAAAQAAKIRGAARESIDQASQQDG